MNLSFSKEDQEFQQEVRSFIEQNYPSEIKEKQDSGIPLSKEDTVKWHKILNDKGWLAVNWPEELGGTGWTKIDKDATNEADCAKDLEKASPKEDAESPGDKDEYEDDSAWF